MYSQSILDEIRDRVSIVALIGERVPLKKAGRNFKGCCPFHSEKTPSFMVSDEKRIYHCFGCGEGGNVFSFFMKYDNLNFREAVELIADRAGVALPKLSKNDSEDDELQKKKDWCYRVNELAFEYYKKNFLDEKKGLGARNYLKSRGFLKTEFFKQLFLGFAEDKWDGLVEFFKAKNVPLPLAEELGLIKKRENGYYDFFRNRIMFPVIMPLFSKKGEKVVAFSGRTLGSDKDTAKYLNSPDSLVYHKGYTLFGLNTALAEIRKKDQVVLVEGNFDCFRFQMHGFLNVVAPLGTALTSGHLKLLSRFTKNFIVIFDGDEAGKKAAVRSLPLFLDEALVPKVVALENGFDPDSFVAEKGAGELEELIAKAGTLFEWVIDETCSVKGADTKGKISAVEELKPFFQLLKGPVESDIYKKRIASKLLLDESAVSSALAGRKHETFSGSERVKAAPTLERGMIELMLTCPETVEIFKKEVEAGAFIDDAYRAIAAIIFDEYKKSGSVDVEHLATSADSELRSSILSLSLSDAKFDEPIVAAKEMAASLKKKAAKKKIGLLLNEIKKMPAHDERMSEYLAEVNNLSREIHRKQN